MKLVRYGRSGKEKPGLIDDAGNYATCPRSWPTSAACNSLTRLLPDFPK